MVYFFIICFVILEIEIYFELNLLFLYIGYFWYRKVLCISSNMNGLLYCFLKGWIVFFKSYRIFIFVLCLCIIYLICWNFGLNGVIFGLVLGELGEVYIWYLCGGFLVFFVYVFIWVLDVFCFVCWGKEVIC